MDLKGQKIKSSDWALSGLAVMAKLNRGISMEMLQHALGLRFKEPILSTSLTLVDRVEI
jgi:2-oxoglutarate/2-oxoacid ferredoxin oxidoreductase subunit beta